MYRQDFPGVYGLSKTIEAAKKRILKAMQLYIQHSKHSQNPTPQPRSIQIYWTGPAIIRAHGSLRFQNFS